MIPLLLILLSGVAWGEVPYSPDPYNPTYPVDIIEQSPTYVVEVSSSAAPRYSVERLFAQKDARVPCGDDYETCRDLAEALNEAHRRRMK